MMGESLRPDEATRALSEIGQRQEQVIEQATIPDWYWRVVAVLMVILAAATDTRRPAVVASGVIVFVIGMLIATGRVALHPQRRARVRNTLLGPAGVLAILGFVALVLLVSLPVALVLQANGYGHPATFGVLAGAVVMAVGGPILGRYLRRTMLAHRVGAPR
jgi:hypothetical protein